MTAAGEPTDRAPVRAFLERVEAGEPAAALTLAREQLDERGVTGVVTELLAPVQREVGERWHAGRYTVAQEHLVSAVVDDALGMLAPSAPRPSDTANTLALVCAEGEWHATPARMAALLVRDAGWSVQFLGASTPQDHLRTTLRTLRPQALAVSCTLPLSLPGVPSLVEVGAELDLPVLVGGRAFDPDGRRAAAVGALGSFAEVGAAVRELEVWLDRPPAPPDVGIDEGRRAQRVTLADHRDRIVTEAYGRLEAAVPGMARFDERQRRHTRQDLDYILRFADVAVSVDDPTVFLEFVAWLQGLLEARGVPASVLASTMEAVAVSLGDGLPDVASLVATAQSHLEGAAG